MKCKFSLENPTGGNNWCLNQSCRLTKCWFEDPQNNCKCFEPHEDGVITARLMTDKENLTDLRTLTIQNCDKVILKPKGLEVEVKIEKDNFDDFDYIVINGLKFRREK